MGGGGVFNVQLLLLDRAYAGVSAREQPQLELPVEGAGRRRQVRVPGPVWDQGHGAARRLGQRLRVLLLGVREQAALLPTAPAAGDERGGQHGHGHLRALAGGVGERTSATAAAPERG